jgi:general secretion pathway protein G
MRKEARPAREGRARGVTLFEVLIVVAILALISSGVGLAALAMWRRAQNEHAHTDARIILTGVEAWQKHHNEVRCPSFDEMVREKLLKRDSTGRDPWGEPFRIDCVEGDATVTSKGADRKAETEDDIRIPPV